MFKALSRTRVLKIYEGVGEKHKCQNDAKQTVSHSKSLKNEFSVIKDSHTYDFRIPTFVKPSIGQSVTERDIKRHGRPAGHLISKSPEDTVNGNLKVAIIGVYYK